MVIEQSYESSFKEPVWAISGLTHNDCLPWKLYSDSLYAKYFWTVFLYFECLFVETQACHSSKEF